MKLIILGLDGIHEELVRKLKKEMPNLNRHLDEDSGGVLKSVFPFLSSTCWSSFQTGKNVANHGIAGYFKYGENLELSLVTGNDLKEKTFYEIFDEQGFNCFIMNLPYTHPPRIKGDVVYSWLYASNDVNKLVNPPTLIQKYPSLKNLKNTPTRNKGTVKYLETTHEIFLTQQEVMKEVIKSNKYEVSFFLISCTDSIQHKALIELMGDIDNKKARAAKKNLSDLDKFIGWVDEHKSKDTNVIIMSDHGHKIYKGKFFVNSWLKNHGYLQTSKDGINLREEINKTKKGTLDLSAAINFIKRHPFLLRNAERCYEIFKSLIPWEIIKQPKVDLANSKAYCRSYGESIIFINKNLSLEEREKIKKEILQGLNSIPGIKAFDCKTYFVGKYQDELGDIVIPWEDYEIDISIGEKEMLLTQRAMHSFDGMINVYGPDFKKKVRVNNANITDVMPTMLHLFGLSLPQDVDGKVLKEIFKEGSRAAEKEIHYVMKDKNKEEKERISCIVESISI